MPIEDRWDAEFALSIIGVPWLPNPKGNEPHELEEPVVLHPERPDLEAVAPDVAENLSAPRRIYITVADLEKPGYTKGCEACSQTLTGKRMTGVNHNKQCRERMEPLIRKSNPGRAEAHRVRQIEIFAKNLQEEKEREAVPAATAALPVPEPIRSEPVVAATPEATTDAAPGELESAAVIRIREDESSENTAPKRRRTWNDDTDMQMLIATYHEDCIANILLLQESKQYPVCEEPTFEELYDKMLAFHHPLNSGSGGGMRTVSVYNVLPADDDPFWDQIASIEPQRTVYDENTGEVLDAKLVADARAYGAASAGTAPSLVLSLSSADRYDRARRKQLS